MPLLLRFFHSVRPATMPARIVCNSPNRRWAAEGGAQGLGLNNSQYSRMCAASTPVSFVATQLGARKVPNLGRIDDADDMTRLVKCARNA
jgi:hypothetical protein